MLESSGLRTSFPASDLQRARAFFADVLGLTPTSEIEDAAVLEYDLPGGARFMVYRTEYAGTAGHTLGTWTVADIDAEVRSLSSRGVQFETYDLPGVEWDGPIATAPFGRAAWFKDSEGNIHGLEQRGGG